MNQRMALFYFKVLFCATFASLIKLQVSTLVKLIKLKQHQFVHRKKFSLQYCSIQQSWQCK